MPTARSLPVVDSVPQRTLPEPAEQHFVLDDFGVQRISDEASAALACVITKNHHNLLSRHLELVRSRIGLPQ